MIQQLRGLDVNAEQLYDKLLEAVNVTIDRATGEIVQDSVGVKLLRLGFPSLIFRLTGSAASVSSPG